MAYQTSLLEALRDWGLYVDEVNGWTTRGKDTLTPGGAVNHHTGGPEKGTMPTLNVLINGRSDLPGPLCNVGQSRSTVTEGTKLDRVYLVAAGRANHAGSGGWKGLSGNSSVFGLEVEHTGGPNEPFSDARFETTVRIHKAFAQVGGYSSDMVCQHKEWAPSRKIDFINQPGDTLRAAIKNMTLEDIVKFTLDEAKKEVTGAFQDIAGRTPSADDTNLWAHAVSSDARKLFELHRALAKESRERQDRLIKDAASKPPTSTSGPSLEDVAKDIARRITNG